jgi:hypothetical protein
MNWDKVGTLADVIAALAAIASVAYLAFQIRQQTKSSQAEAIRGNVEGDAAMLAVAQDAELAQIFVRALSRFSDLEPAEALRFSYTFGVMIGSVARQYENVLLGFARESHFLDRNYGHLALLEKSGGAGFWHTYQKSVPPEFREFVNREMNIKSPSETGQETTRRQRGCLRAAQDVSFVLGSDISPVIWFF